MKKEPTPGDRLICIGNSHLGKHKGLTTSSMLLGSVHTFIRLAGTSSFLTKGPNTLYDSDRHISWDKNDFISYPDEIDLRGEK